MPMKRVRAAVLQSSIKMAVGLINEYPVDGNNGQDAFLNRERAGNDEPEYDLMVTELLERCYHPNHGVILIE